MQSSGEKQVPSVDPIFTGRKILLVEDDRICRRVLTAILERKGVATVSVDSGEEALARYDALAPDMIILDVGLPGIDGYETCRRLQERYGSKCAPVLFVTAKDRDEDVALGFSAGGSDYVRKPVHEKEVLARVRAHLANRILARQRESLVDDLSEAVKAKNHLLGTVAHDLRNPLASVLSLSDFMQQDAAGTLSPNQLKMAKLIFDASESMLTLVNELLDSAKVEAGQLNLKRDQHDLADVVARAVEFARLTAVNKGSTIHVRGAEREVVATIDLSKIRQVVDNLISNAVKFSPPGAVISVEVGDSSRGPFVSVRDQGPGIPASERDKLFQAYGTLSARPTGGEQSTGLGLCICRKIVEAHGGSIEVENLFPVGCEFRFTLPVR